MVLDSEVILRKVVSGQILWRYRIFFMFELTVRDVYGQEMNLFFVGSCIWKLD